MRRFHRDVLPFRLSRLRNRPGFAPSLRYFMLRHEALLLYRNVLKVARQVAKRPDGEQLAMEIRQQARQEFAMHDNDDDGGGMVDEQTMRVLLVDGRQKLDYLLQMVMFTSSELDQAGLQDHDQEQGPSIREYETKPL